MFHCGGEKGKEGREMMGQHDRFHDQQQQKKNNRTKLRFVFCGFWMNQKEATDVMDDGRGIKQTEKAKKNKKQNKTQKRHIQTRGNCHSFIHSWNRLLDRRHRHQYFPSLLERRRRHSRTGTRKQKVGRRLKRAENAEQQGEHQKVNNDNVKIQTHTHTHIYHDSAVTMDE